MDPELGDESYGYLTTIGRATARPHSIEIWFVADGATIYMLSGSGGTSDWCKNLLRNPKVTFRVRDVELRGLGRIVSDPEEDTRAREFLVAKYQPRYGGDLTSWREHSQPFAVDIDV